MLVLCVVGSYALRNNAFDVVVMTFAGAVGYLLLKGGFPIIALVVGLVLGPIAESGFRRAMIISDGSLSWALEPVPLVLLLLSCVALLLPAVAGVVRSSRSGSSDGHSGEEEEEDQARALDGSR